MSLLLSSQFQLEKLEHQISNSKMGSSSQFVSSSFANTHLKFHVSSSSDLVDSSLPMHSLQATFLFLSFPTPNLCFQNRLLNIFLPQALKLQLILCTLAQIKVQGSFYSNLSFAKLFPQCQCILSTNSVTSQLVRS